MNNQSFIAEKLHFKLSLPELQEYYHTLKTKYEHLHWTWEKNNIHIDDIAAAECIERKNTLMNGWPLQSNMKDRSLPASMLKTKHPTIEWYNTELMFGIMKRLQEKIPYAYRWTLFVLPPGGEVVSHVDNNQYVIIIPIQWDVNAIFNLNNVAYSFLADGSAYVLDVEYAHDTANHSDIDRVNLIARIPRDKITDLLSLTGEI
jgi:hypothetical protein